MDGQAFSVKHEPIVWYHYCDLKRVSCSFRPQPFHGVMLSRNTKYTTPALNFEQDARVLNLYSRRKKIELHITSLYSDANEGMKVTVSQFFSRKLSDWKANELSALIGQPQQIRVLFSVDKTPKRVTRPV